MRRYLLVLNTDLLVVDEDQTSEPVIDHLAAKHEQERCEVTVLSLVDTSQTKLPATELLLGAPGREDAGAPSPITTSAPRLSTG